MCMCVRERDDSPPVIRSLYGPSVTRSDVECNTCGSTVYQLVSCTVRDGQSVSVDSVHYNSTGHGHACGHQVIA